MTETISNTDGFIVYSKKGTGALKSPLDLRQIKTSTIEKDGMIAKAKVYPVEYKTDLSSIPVLDQGKQVSCTAYAMGTMKEFYDMNDTGTHTPYSRRSLYADCKQTDGIPNIDGTYPTHTMKRLRSRGINKADTILDDITLGRAEYNGVKFTDSINAEAQEAIIKAYLQVSPLTFQTLKNAIYDYGLVAILIELDNEFFKYRGGALVPPKEIVSGHEMVAYGYDEKFIYFRNSHGTTWGLSGDGKLDARYMPYIKEALVMFDLPNEYVKSLIKKKEILQKLLELYRAIKALTK